MNPYLKAIDSVCDSRNSAVHLEHLGITSVPIGAKIRRNYTGVQRFPFFSNPDWPLVAHVKLNLNGTKYTICPTLCIMSSIQFTIYQYQGKRAKFFVIYC